MPRVFCHSQVIKLDIDNDVIELDLMKVVESNATVRNMIGEMMFEMHYYSPDMQPYFGVPSTTYIDVVQLFHKLRQSGLRLHYWP